MGLGNPNVSSLDEAAKVEKFNMNARSQVQCRFTFLTLSNLTYSIVIGTPLSIADPDLLLPNETGAPDRDVAILMGNWIKGFAAFDAMVGKGAWRSM